MATGTLCNPHSLLDVVEAAVEGMQYHLVECDDKPSQDLSQCTFGGVHPI